jgi:hypothetical protein
MRKKEFSKKLAAAALAIACISLALFNVMALLSLFVSTEAAGFSLDAVGTVSTAIFGTCFAYLVTYAAKSFAEKHSRNKYGLDADGNPFKPPDTEQAETDEYRAEEE